MTDAAKVIELVDDIRKGKFYQWGELVTLLGDMQRDAMRYRWLRDAHPATERVIAMDWKFPLRPMRHEVLDAEVDKAMEEMNRLTT